MNILIGMLIGLGIIGLVVVVVKYLKWVVDKHGHDWDQLR